MRNLRVRTSTCDSTHASYVTRYINSNIRRRRIHKSESVKHVYLSSIISGISAGVKKGCFVNTTYDKLRKSIAQWFFFSNGG